MPLRGYMTASILHPVSLKRNRKLTTRRTLGAAVFWLAMLGIAFYLIIGGTP